MSSYKFSDLLNRTIDKVKINTDNTVLRIYSFWSGKFFGFRTEGDCCSYSWIEHVENAEYLAGSKVLEVIDIDVDSEEFPLPEAEKQPDQLIQFYGLEFKLENRPSFRLEYRNSSNGYYGGYITEERLSSSDLEAMTDLYKDF